MFEEGQGYAPVVTDAHGAVTVVLGADHPGIDDPEYRLRRNEIAALAGAWRDGDPTPVAVYTDEEHAVWRDVTAQLRRQHERLACRAARDGGAALHLPAERIPQLDEVTALLAPLSGFRYLPAAGLVPLREFYGTLADRCFWSTQYIRHHSVPLYTPEPDVIHEVIGHATTLANADYARMYVAAGEATRRVETAAALEFVSRVFWFSLEFGVVHEADGPKAYGAGLLSSYGEIEELVHADLRPLDIARMGTQEYDIGHYQPVLFAAASWAEVVEVVGGFFERVDDDLVARLRER